MRLGSKTRWVMASVMVPIIVATIAILPNIFANGPRELSSPQAQPAPDADTRSAAIFAMRELAGSWSPVGDCNYPMSLHVVDGMLEIRNPDDDNSLAERYRIVTRDQNGLLADDDGVAAQFRRDGADLIYVRAGVRQRFTRC